MAEDTPEKIIEQFLGSTPGPETHQEGPGRPTAEQAEAKEAAEKQVAESQALRELMPQVLPMIGECIRIPWDIWADRTQNKLKVQCDFLRLSETEARQVAQASLPMLAKWVGPFAIEHGPELVCLIAVAAVTVPRVVALRRLERYLSEHGGKLPEPPPPEPPATEQHPAEPLAPEPPKAIIKPKHRGRPRKK